MSTLKNPFAPQTGAAPVIRLLSNVAAAASGNVTYTPIVALGNTRYIRLSYAVDPASATGRIAFAPLVTTSASLPLADDDVWGFLPYSDYSSSALTISGSLPSGADWSAAPSPQAVTYSRLAILQQTPTAAANEIRQTTDSISVAGFTYLQIAYWESADTANPGNIDYLDLIRHL